MWLYNGHMCGSRSESSGCYVIFTDRGGGFSNQHDFLGKTQGEQKMLELFSCV